MRLPGDNRTEAEHTGPEAVRTLSNTGVTTRPAAPPQPVRPLVVGLVSVLSVVGVVVAVQSAPRWQWAERCRAAGGQVSSHADGHEPYLAHGSTITWTCRAADGRTTSWP